jgi:hypothetical protein
VKRASTARKINVQSRVRQQITPDQDIVRRVKRGNNCDLHLSFEKLMREHDRSHSRANTGPTCLMDSPGFLKLKRESVGNIGADGSVTTPRINLSKHVHRAANVSGLGDVQLEGGAILEEFLNRLVDCELGPAGFFVLVHRDSRQR